jgi:hypothetical protein
MYFCQQCNGLNCNSVLCFHVKIIVFLLCFCLCWVGVKLGLLFWGRNMGRGCSRIGCKERYWTERDEATDEWWRLHNEKFYCLCSSPNIIRMWCLCDRASLIQ